MINIIREINKTLDIIAEAIADKLLEISGAEKRVLCPVRVEVDYDED